MLSLQDRKILAVRRSISGQDICFKSISRDKNAAWSNRFIKDHNDLLYDADPQSISNRLKASAKKKVEKKPFQPEHSPIKKYEYSPAKQRQLVKTSQSSRNIKKGLNSNNFISSMNQYVKTNIVGTQTGPTASKNNMFINSRDVVISHFQPKVQSQDRRYKIKQSKLMKQVPQQIQQPTKDVSMMGLSTFQFKKTIEGKISSKSNHHIDYGKSKTDRINNLNRVWHNDDDDQEMQTYLLEKEKVNGLNKIHQFKSYSAHKLFFSDSKMQESNGCGNGGSLDKIFDVNNAALYNIVREKVIKDYINYRIMTARPSLRVPPGNHLNYQTGSINAMGLGNSKRSVMEMIQTQKKLIFNRQVISPTRGCFR